MKYRSVIIGISLVVLFIWLIWLVFCKFYGNLMLLSSKTAINLSNTTIESAKVISDFKILWKYNFGNYIGRSSIDLVNTRNELYASIVPDIFQSKAEYSLYDNEIKSLLFIEDKSFVFRDLTISIRWILGALFNSFGSWRDIAWASGITQQLVKNLLLEDNSREITRKVKELIISYYIQYNYSKISIVNEYINRMSYGKNVFWEIYLWKKFGEKLSLEESFFLNAMLKNLVIIFKINWI